MLLWATGAGLLALMLWGGLLARSEMAAVGVFAAGGIASGFLLQSRWAAALPLAAAFILGWLDDAVAEVDAGYSLPLRILIWTVLAAPGVVCAGVVFAIRRSGRRRSGSRGQKGTADAA
jgi:hypothetical protein